jgi:hypothetical protein
MKISELKIALNCLFDSNTAVMVWGSPGIGKSYVVKEIAKEKGIGLIDPHVMTLDPVEARGTMKEKEERTIWCPPKYLPNDGTGILFLDEITQARGSTQRALLQFVYDSHCGRRLGDYILPKDWRIIAAGNFVSDNTDAVDLVKALRTRFCNLKVEFDAEEWLNWAIRNNLPSEIIAFGRFRPSCLYTYDAESDDINYACPRTFTEMAKSFYDLVKLPYNIKLEMVQGFLGNGPGLEFVTYLEVYKEIPDKIEILKNPKTFPVEPLLEKPSVTYALIGVLFDEIKNAMKKDDTETVNRAVTFAERLPKTYGVLLLKDAVNNISGILKCHKVIQWLKDNKGVMLD